MVVKFRPIQRRCPDGRIDLPEVTMVAVSSFAISATLRALHQSMLHIRFGAVKLLTDHAPTGMGDGIEWVPIKSLGSRDEYSRFMLKELHRHVGTGHALVVQWDGYVINAHAWDDAFLAYDYIGAPWPQFDDGFTVGNGGFSLRSARLLAASTMLPADGDWPEDVVIGRRCRTLLENDYGIRFAEEEVARAFAFERLPALDTEFGFHGVFNMATMLDDVEFHKIYSGVESRLLGFREQRDLIEIAIKRKSWLLLSSILRPHFGHLSGVKLGLKLFTAGLSSYFRSVRKHPKAH